MNLPPIIGITGRKYNGKDTIAHHFRDKYEYHQISFAEPLKNVCGLLFGFNQEQLHGSLKETPDENWFGLTPRQVLQFVGTNMFRDHMGELSQNFGQDFWLLCAQNNIKKILSQNDNARIVVSDVRFPNEIELIKKLGGINIRVKRPEMYNLNNTDVHVSEQLIDQLDVDMEVLNAGTKSELYDILDSLVENKKLTKIYKQTEYL